MHIPLSGRCWVYSTVQKSLFCRDLLQRDTACRASYKHCGPSVMHGLA